MTDYIKKDEFVAKAREANPDVYTSNVSDDMVYNDMLSYYPEYKNVVYEEQGLITKGISKIQEFGEVLTKDMDEYFEEELGIAPSKNIIQTDLETIFAEGKAILTRSKSGLKYLQADNKYDYIDDIYNVGQIKRKLLSNEDLVEEDYAVLQEFMQTAGVPTVRRITREIKESDTPAETLASKIDELIKRKYLDGPVPRKKAYETYEKAVDSVSQYRDKVNWISNTFDSESVKDWYNTQVKISEAMQEVSEVESGLNALAERKGYDRQSLSYMVGAGIPTVGASLAASILLAPVSGGTSILAGIASFTPAMMLSTPEALDTYMSARQSGANREDATNYAIASFAFNTVMEKIGIDAMLVKFGGKAIPKALVAALTEGATEFTQEEFGQILSLYGYNNQQLAQMTAEEKINAFVGVPLKAFTVGGILGFGASSSFNAVDATYNRFRSKAVLKGLDPARIAKYEDFLYKNKRIGKKISEMLEQDHIKDFSEKGIRQELKRRKIPDARIEETYAALMDNPVFRAKRELADTGKAAKTLLGWRSASESGSSIGAAMTVWKNLPGILNRAAFDPTDIMMMVSPTLHRQAMRVYRQGQIDVNEAKGAMLTRATTAFKALDMPLRKFVKIGENGKYNRQVNQIITAYMNMQQGKAANLGLSKDEMAAIQTYVESNPSIANFITQMRDVFDLFHTYLNEGYKVNHKGKELPKEQNYFPLIYDVLANKGTDFADAIESVFDKRVFEIANPKDPKYVRERVKHAKQTIDLNVPIDTLVNSMAYKIADYYGMSAPAAQVQTMLKAIGPDLRRSYGDKMYTYLNEVNKSTARGIAINNDLLRWASKTMNRLREMTYSVLNMNTTVWATQSASFWNGANEIGINAAMEGARIVAENPIKAVQEMYDLSKEAKFRMGVDYTAAEIRDVLRSVKTDLPGKTARELRKAAQAGMLPMRIVDMYTTASIWQGAYNKYINDNGSSNIALAIEYADNAIAASQPMTNTIHKSMLSRTPVINILSQFGAARIKGGAQLTKSVVNMSNSKANPIDVIRAVTMTKILPSVSVALARTFFSKWEDDPEEEMWNNFVDAFIGSNIYLGQILSSWKWHNGYLVVPAAGRPFKLAIDSVDNLIKGKYDEAIYDAIELQLNRFGISVQVPFKKVSGFLSNFE